MTPAFKPKIDEARARLLKRYAQAGLLPRVTVTWPPADGFAEYYAGLKDLAQRQARAGGSIPATAATRHKV